MDRSQPTQYYATESDRISNTFPSKFRHRLFVIYSTLCTHWCHHRDYWPVGFSLATYDRATRCFRNNSNHRILREFTPLVYRRVDNGFAIFKLCEFISGVGEFHGHRVRFACVQSDGNGHSY